MEDLWAMVRAGKEPVGIFLDVARALRADRNRLVVEFTADHMDTIGRSLVPEQSQKEYRESGAAAVCAAGERSRLECEC